MNIKHTHIFINNARFFAYHGVLEQELLTGAHFYVSLEATVDFTASLESDQMSDTTSYADLFEIVKHEMSIRSKLIEHVGGRILKSIFEKLPDVQAVKLYITKENPPMGADCNGAGICIEASRDTSV